jgi:hypothetical protein
MTLRILLTAFVVVVLASSSLYADETDTVQQAGAYLTDPNDAQLEKALANYRGEIDSIITALRAKEPTDWKEIAGKHDAQARCGSRTSRSCHGLYYGKAWYFDFGDDSLVAA